MALKLNPKALSPHTMQIFVLSLESAGDVVIVFIHKFGNAGNHEVLSNT